jgi:hypothetical protein
MRLVWGFLGMHKAWFTLHTLSEFCVFSCILHAASMGIFESA